MWGLTCLTFKWLPAGQGNFVLPLVNLAFIFLDLLVPGYIDTRELWCRDRGHIGN